MKEKIEMMSWMGVNLEKVLRAEQQKKERRNQDEVLSAFRDLLKKDDEFDQDIINNIFGGGVYNSDIDYHHLDPYRIYHIDQIRELCTIYRLRFLDASLFKGEIPYEAISKLKRLQKDHDTEFHSYKILAPAPMFNLEKKDRDPLLFIPLSPDRFYLVHKWGSDLSPFRKLLVFPFRNFQSLLMTVALAALLIVLSVPDSVMMGPYDQGTGAIRVVFFFYLFIAFSGLTALYGFSRIKNFNANLWDSKYTD